MRRTRFLPALAIVIFYQATGLAQENVSSILQRLDRLEGLAPTSVTAATLPPEDGSGQFYTGYDNAFLRPMFDRDVAYWNAAGGSQAVTEFDWDLEYAPRLWLGYRNANGAGYQLSYWQFDHSMNLNVSERAAQNLQVAFGTGSFTADILVDGSLSAQRSLSLHVADLERARRFLMAGIQVNTSFGVRYVNLRQSYFAYETGGTESLHSEHDFEGFGPTLFMEGRHNLGFWDCIVFGNIRGSFLLGDRGVLVEEPDTGTVFRDYGNGALSILEAQIGVNRTHRFVNGTSLGLELAAETQSWLNAGSGLRSVSTTGSAMPDEGNMGLLGFRFSIVFNF